MGTLLLPNSSCAFRSQFTVQDLSPVEWLLRKMRENIHMQNATWLVSRELAEAAGPWDTRLDFDQDGEYFCLVFLASEGTRLVSRDRDLLQGYRRETGKFYWLFR